MSAEKRHYDSCHGAEFDVVSGDKRKQLAAELSRAIGDGSGDLGRPREQAVGNLFKAAGDNPFESVQIRSIRSSAFNASAAGASAPSAARDAPRNRNVSR